jgi:hypothetical protein
VVTPDCSQLNKRAAARRSLTLWTRSLVYTAGILPVAHAIEAGMQAGDRNKVRVNNTGVADVIDGSNRR